MIWQKKKKKKKKKEIEECISEYVPQPLVPREVSDRIRLDTEKVPVLKSAMDTVVRMEVGGEERELINFSGFNFLGFANDRKVKDAGISALRRYGPGSCGPRQFYGTFDCHLELEEKMAKFVGTATSILYASGLATQTSAVSAFAKRGDFLLIDNGVRHGILLAAKLSRSNTRLFKHNDMQDLEVQMKAVAAEQKRKRTLTRRYVVIEGLYGCYGDVAALPAIRDLCDTYKFRIILDDSFGLGVLGPTGRGVLEHHNLPVSTVEMVLADTGINFTTIGGICAGKQKVTNHQRLNGSGYCFSASNPPYYVCTGIECVDQLLSGSDRVPRLQRNAREFRELLAASVDGLNIGGYEESPLIHMYLTESFDDHSTLEKHHLLQRIVDSALLKGVTLSRAKSIETHPVEPPPSIRVTVTCEHTREQLEKGAAAIAEAAKEVLASTS
eukprot:TRINITY_DN854_c0_g1_i2.p1 TRINITY_DN854_c0_g1~~TRINITY_DN854_c0_g1_i2.p1  ORF type:complete len:441 (+),score=118.95 TRINITY_DN854_c0_g1_i2:940-2262(+)